MKRNVDMKEISDGKLYGLNDMVKADCQDCVGCCDCCKGMGNSIVLDPLDIHRLTVNLEYTFDELLEKHIELNVVDGIILPNLKMAGKEEVCSFLTDQGRCSIHSFRPGICRLFPLGRFYDNGGFQYFLQVHECSRQNCSKIKVKKWIDTPDVKQYEKFIIGWHYFLKDLQEGMNLEQDVTLMKTTGMYILSNFYRKPYGNPKFYAQFEERLEAARVYFGQD